MIPTIVWTLPRPAKSRYKGAFPLYFEQNLVQLLGYPEKILHPFGGMAELGTRVDLNGDLEPDHVADAHDLPFDDETFDLVILDPPYSDDEAQELYGTPKLKPAAYTREAVRVLKDGGWLCVYTDREPARPPRCNHAIRIVVVLRPHHRPRVCGVFQKRKPGMPFYGSETGEYDASEDEFRRESDAVVIMRPAEHKTNGAAPAMSPERRDALSAKDSPPGTDSGNQSGRIGSPE